MMLWRGKGWWWSGLPRISPTRPSGWSVLPDLELLGWRIWMLGVKHQVLGTEKENFRGLIIFYDCWAHNLLSPNSWIFLVQQVLLHRQLCSTVPRKPARQGGGWYQRIASCQVTQSRMNNFRFNNFFLWGCYLWGRALVWRRWLWTLRRKSRSQLETHAGRFQEHQIN